MLFIIFLNDISNTIVNGVFLNADDLKPYTTLISTNDSHNLQDALSKTVIIYKMPCPTFFCGLMIGS